MKTSTLQAKQDADHLYETWIHLGEDECSEQVEAHLESEGYSQDAVTDQLLRLGIYRAQYKIRHFPPA